jgi:thiazole synthase ThiGH ThiG subunit
MDDADAIGQSVSAVSETVLRYVLNNIYVQIIIDGGIQFD